MRMDDILLLGLGLLAFGGVASATSTTVSPEKPEPGTTLIGKEEILATQPTATVISTPVGEAMTYVSGGQQVTLYPESMAALAPGGILEQTSYGAPVFTAGVLEGAAPDSPVAQVFQGLVTPAPHPTEPGITNIGGTGQTSAGVPVSVTGSSLQERMAYLTAHFIPGVGIRI